MKPSLTPHEDAVHRALEQLPEYDDPMKDAVRRIVNSASIEMARLMDRGLGSDAVLNFAASVSVSIITTVAANVASGYAADQRAAADASYRGLLLQTILHGAVEGKPAASARADVISPHDPGRA